ncbi:MAG: fimbrillin family protein, partial [Bacteroidaceae bacterium]|nr:fimbrillin family protein [Bacteroidaceae bacterium]
MKISKIFLLSSVALMAVACQDKKDEPKPTPTPTPTPGEDVCFGGQLDSNVGSRTIYGGEVTEGDNYSFPIYWLKSDKVFIASPQCREGMNQGTFGLPSDADGRDYAGSFIKESGAIQWGSTDADFYSIYPQLHDEWEVKTASDFSATNATFELNMPETQFCKVTAPSSGNPVMTTADMNACFMYARTTDVENGTSPVELQYNPLSTAIRFTLRGPNVQGQSVIVSRIRLIGPDGAALSGKFQVNLTGSTPVVTASGNTSNIVNIYANDASGSYLKLSYGQSIELNAFIIPVDGLKIDGSWKIEVALSGGRTATKELTPTSTTANTNIVAGKIHRLGNMPYLPTDELDLTKWLEFMPRNIYLSEISIPGSWNSLNSDFQTLATSAEAGSEETEDISKKTIDQQYALGCRAFHLDTRFRRINATSTDFTNLG